MTCLIQNVTIGVDVIRIPLEYNAFNSNFFGSSTGDMMLKLLTIIR